MTLESSFSSFASSKKQVSASWKNREGSQLCCVLGAGGEGVDKWGLAAGITELSTQLMEKTSAGPILCLISEEKGGYWI